MIQSVAFQMSQYSVWSYKSWEGLVEPLREQGIDGLEIMADTREPEEPFPTAYLTGYQIRTPLDWLDCYCGKTDRLTLSFEGKGEIESFFQTGKPEDILNAYREDLAFGLSMNTPYVVFQVSNADYEEAYTFRWTHTDYQVMDACIKILNALLRDVEPSFTLLIGNNRWPGFSFTEPKKTEYLLSRINYPHVGIMLDTGRLLSTKWRTKNQAAGLEYIKSMLDKHGELSKSIQGLHFNYCSTSNWIKKGRKVPDILPSRYYDERHYLKTHIRNLDHHTCWTDPACVSLIDRIEPKYLTHRLDNRIGLNWSGALTRQLKAINKGRELQAQGFAPDAEKPSELHFI